MQQACDCQECTLDASPAVPCTILRTSHQVSKSLRFSCAVPRTYEEDVQRAIWTFRHQRVFCPRARRLVHLRPLPAGGLASTAAVPSAVAPGDEALDFLGPLLPDDIACRIAAGAQLVCGVCATMQGEVHMCQAQGQSLCSSCWYFC